MPAVTSIILIGHSHPNNGGLTWNSSIELVEGDRPVFVFHRMSNSNSNLGRSFRLWPTLEFMLDDLIFMILYMHQVPEVVDFMEFIGLHESCMQSKRIIMYDDFSEVTRNELYRLVKANSDFSKIAICLFEGSILKDSLKNLNEYTCDVEVLMSSYRREYSRWEGAQIVTGSL